MTREVRKICRPRAKRIFDREDARVKKDRSPSLILVKGGKERPILRKGT
jgi:hypothetical protein